jgi:hypothetical protein
MSLVHVATVAGFMPVYATGDLIFGLTSDGLGCWSPGMDRPDMISRIDESAVLRCLGRNRLLKRVFRLGTACGVGLEAGRFLLADRESIRHVDYVAATVHVEKRFDEGMRALKLTHVRGLQGFRDGVYYGDYGSNASQRPLSIHHRDDRGVWRRAYTFPAGTAEHIHAVVPDYFRSCVWILAGDYGEAAGIWLARDGFKTIEPAMRGTQQARSCVAFAVEDGLLYGTDSHLEANAIRVLQERNGNWVSSIVRPMVGSSIYGGRFCQAYVFTTAYEPGPPSGCRLFDLVDLRPGPGIIGRHCEVIVGSLSTGFWTELRSEVDWWPKRLFQFSAFVVPAIDRNGTLLPVYAAGLKRDDGATLVYQLRAAA